MQGLQEDLLCWMMANCAAYSLNAADYDGMHGRPSIIELALD